MVNTEKSTHSLMSPLFLNFLVVMLLLAIAPAIISNSLTKTVTRDEQMYCTAAVLLSQGEKMYVDFPYVAQLPYHPILCAAVFKITNTSHYLFTARMFSCFLDIAGIVILILIIKRIFDDEPIAYPLAIAGGLLYLFNPYIDYIIGMAWNHNLVIFATLASIYLFITLNKTKALIIPKVVLIASLLTIATFSRPTTVLLWPIFLIMTCRKALIANSFSTPCFFVGGSLVTAAVPLWVISQAWHAFWLNAFKIPALNAQFLMSQNLSYSKIDLTIEAIIVNNPFLIISIVGYLLTLIFIYRRDKDINLTDDFLLILLVTIAFIIITYLPPTCWGQYFAIPVPFFLLLMMASMKSIMHFKGKFHFALLCMIIAASSIISIFSHPQVLGKTEHFRYDRSLLEPFKINKIAKEISGAVNTDQPILTLTPLYALEGNLPIYNQLAAGIFTYRIADMLTPEEREIANIIGPDEIANLVKVRPPAAVIVGPEFKELEYLENSLVTSDVKGWPTKTLKNNIILFIAPED